MVLVSVIIFGIAYWYYFSKEGQLWRINNEIEKSWSYSRDELRKMKKEDEETQRRTFSEKKVAADASRVSSSSQKPIVLEGKGNFVTGDDVTFMVPTKMRRLRLTIQERNGKYVDSYSLPNAFISIRPGQRLNLKVN
jgi:hypothetical protein